MWQIKIKKAGKIFARIGSGALLSLALLWAGFFIWGRWQDHEETKSVARALAEQERLAREDAYGGETINETYDLFLDALRNGDRELAIKYFVTEKQDAWRIYLARIADAKFLDPMIADLENVAEDAALPDDHFRFINGQWKIVSL